MSNTPIFESDQCRTATASEEGGFDTTFLFNIGAGAGALLLRKNWPRNHVLGAHLMTDGSMSKHVIVPASGTVQFPTDKAVAENLFTFDLVEPEAMKARLNEVSEVVIQDAGHAPFIEKPEGFNEVFQAHLRGGQV